MNVQYLEHASTERGLSLSFFSGGTTWLREKHPVCTNSVLSSVQAFMGLSHAAFGNRHLMPGNGDTSVTVGNYACVKGANHLQRCRNREPRHFLQTRENSRLCTLQIIKPELQALPPGMSQLMAREYYYYFILGDGLQGYHQNDITLAWIQVRRRYNTKSPSLTIRFS